MTYKVETYINGVISTVKLLNEEKVLESVKLTIEDGNLTIFNTGVLIEDNEASAEAILERNGVTYSYIYYKLPLTELMVLLERY